MGKEPLAENTNTAEETINNSGAAESASGNAKSDFLFNMSHDIRTPMNAILGFAQMGIKHIDDRERTQECFEKIQQAGNLLLSLIDSSLEIGSAEAGTAILREDEGDIYSVFAPVEAPMESLARDKGISLSFEYGDVYDRYVWYDSERCTRIFINIISNAVKFTHECGRVNVKCVQTGPANDGVGIYRFTFEDNGIGMSEEFREHVFERFSRERNTTMSGIQGNGLGMAVCKSFVEIMGGTIECESTEGEGTVFTVTLPFRIRENAGAEGTYDEDEAQGLNSIMLFGKKVLLVEDNEMNREIAADILSEQGLVVEEAEDGAYAVTLLDAKGPYYYDFILMDIQMPVMNGYEAAREIRKMYPDVPIPIIALSANVFPEDMAASRAAGMDAHLPKPINMNELFLYLTKSLK